MQTIPHKQRSTIEGMLSHTNSHSSTSSVILLCTSSIFFALKKNLIPRTKICQAEDLRIVHVANNTIGLMNLIMSEQSSATGSVSGQDVNTSLSCPVLVTCKPDTEETLRYQEYHFTTYLAMLRKRMLISMRSLQTNSHAIPTSLFLIESLNAASSISSVIFSLEQVAENEKESE